jgi:hypothetical protein
VGRTVITSAFFAGFHARNFMYKAVLARHYERFKKRAPALKYRGKQTALIKLNTDV